MSVPPGLIEWARGVELSARSVHQELSSSSPALPGKRCLPTIEESRSDLNRILAEDSTGLLRRVLSRPPWQLQAKTSPPRASLDRRLASAIASAREAMVVSEKLRALFERVEGLRGRFVERYPNFVSAAFARTRLRVEDLERLRRPSEVDMSDRRLSALIKEFDARDRALATLKFDVDSWTLAPDESATSWELASACALAVIKRERLARRTSGDDVADTTLSRHLNQGSQTVPIASASQAVAGQALLLEDVLRRTVRLKSGVRLRGVDAPLWGAALAVGADTEARYRVRPNAFLESSTPQSGEDEAPSHSHYIIPLGDDLVAISQSWRSAVRLWSARLALGLDVDGQVIADEVNRAPDVAAADIAELFSGFRTASAWYKPHTRVRATVIGHFHNGWIARLKRRGVLHRGSNTPWKSTPTDSSEFRVLFPAGPAPLEPLEMPDRIADPEGAPAGEFAGFTTTEVVTSIAGDQIAWRRNPSNRGRAAHRAIDAEWSLMTRLARGSRARARVLTPLTWTSGEAAKSRLPLYRVAIGVAPNAPQFKSLVALNLSWRLFTLREIAKAVSEVHRHGVVLGTVHHDQFVYGVDPNGPNHLLVPRPTLAYAPGVCQFGDRHVADTRLEHESVFFQNIRTPLLNPFAASGQAAAVYHDVFSFGVCALELLAAAPLSNGTVFYTDLRDAVHADSERFAHARLATRLADAVAAGASDTWLERLFSALNKSLKLDAEAWLAV